MKNRFSFPNLVRFVRVQAVTSAINIKAQSTNHAICVFTLLLSSKLNQAGYQC